MPLISVTRRAMGPSSFNRLACAYIHQKTATPRGELFVPSAFPDNFDDPEFIAETGKENKSEEKTRIRWRKLLVLPKLNPKPTEIILNPTTVIRVEE